MSTQTVQQPVTSTGKRRPLYHYAKDGREFRNALAGRPWIALCGTRCKGGCSAGDMRRPYELAPMQRCAVCQQLQEERA